MLLTNGQTIDNAGVPRDKPKAGWHKAKLPALNSSTTAEAALTEIILGGVEHLRGNEVCVLAREHEEGVHQMRVATRRLRSCLALYDKFIPAEQLDYISGELKWLIGELGPARDWDVFAAGVFAPVAKQIEDKDRLAALRDHIERQRDEAYARAQAAVGSHRYLGLVLLLNSWAEGRGWRDAGNGEHSAELQTKAADIARELLHQIYEQLLAAGADFDHLDPEQRHKVRIQLKKLRYATEFFSSLYPKPKATPYLAAMKTLQDDLGTSNDVDVARKLLKRVLKQTGGGKERARLSYAAGLVVGWHSHVSNGREQGLIKAWHRFAARAPYWETATAGAAGDTNGADTRGNDAITPSADGTSDEPAAKHTIGMPLARASVRRRRAVGVTH
jgi:CHAD domain-containing protein